MYTFRKKGKRPNRRGKTHNRRLSGGDVNDPEYTLDDVIEVLNEPTKQNSVTNQLPETQRFNMNPVGSVRAPYGYSINSDNGDKNKNFNVTLEKDEKNDAIKIKLNNNTLGYLLGWEIFYETTSELSLIHI